MTIENIKEQIKLLIDMAYQQGGVDAIERVNKEMKKEEIKDKNA